MEREDFDTLLKSDGVRYLLGVALGITVRHLRDAPAKLKPVSDLADMKMLGVSLFADGFWHVHREPSAKCPDSEDTAISLAISARGNLLIG